MPFVNRINKLDSVFDGLFSPTLWDDSESLMSHFCHSYRETEDSYIVEADLPGYKKEDVTVTWNAGKIIISAKNQRNGSYYKEFYISNWQSDPDKGNAKLEDGVLTVTLPKSERARGRVIRVE